MNNTISFGSISGIIAWTGRNQIQYVGGSEKLPYVLKDKLYHYFTFNGSQYVLSMTSERDLQEVQS